MVLKLVVQALFGVCSCSKDAQGCILDRGHRFVFAHVVSHNSQKLQLPFEQESLGHQGIGITRFPLSGSGDFACEESFETLGESRNVVVSKCVFGRDRLCSGEPHSWLVHRIPDKFAKADVHVDQRCLPVLGLGCVRKRRKVKLFCPLQRNSYRHRSLVHMRVRVCSTYHLANRIRRSSNRPLSTSSSPLRPHTFLPRECACRQPEYRSS